MALTIMISAPILIVGGIIMALRRTCRCPALLVIILPLMAAVIGLVMSRAIPLFRAMQVKLDRINQVMRETLVRRPRHPRVRADARTRKRRFDAANDDLFETALQRQPPVRDHDPA